MTYNVFAGTLSLTHSINQSSYTIVHVLAVGDFTVYTMFLDLRSVWEMCMLCECCCCSEMGRCLQLMTLIILALQFQLCGIYTLSICVFWVECVYVLVVGEFSLCTNFVCSKSVLLGDVHAAWIVLTSRPDLPFGRPHTNVWRGALYS